MAFREKHRHLDRAGIAHPTKLWLFFDNGEARLFDASLHLNKGIFQDLCNDVYFRLVKPFCGGVQWPHEQDFGPDTLFLKSELEGTLEAA
ncbi:DUF2442 domain-containing protein [Nodosilinea sp. P-1105]|uniref:DUF2442 domain-containing protein n=1 Tax=Nodosilinea sp. P-1105 TaxID=2546229 RepID=UPI001980EE03|nr:DUF2442 domain-containing protein [Nodosilinea sp. P-1105]